MRPLFASLALVLSLTFFTVPAQAAPPTGEAGAVGNVLDAFHTTASKADEEAYFALLAPNAVFLGTDATERWDKAAFRAFLKDLGYANWDETKNPAYRMFLG